MRFITTCLASLIIFGCTQTPPEQPTYQPDISFSEDSSGTVLRFVNGAELIELIKADTNEKVSFSAFESAKSIPAGHYQAQIECRDRPYSNTNISFTLWPDKTVAPYSSLYLQESVAHDAPCTPSLRWDTGE